MKKDYGTPFVKIVLFNAEDVITASVSVDGDDNMVFWPKAEEASVWEE